LAKTSSFRNTPPFFSFFSFFFFSPSVLVAQKVAVGVYKGVTTSELDGLAAETAASMTSKHPDYAQVRKKTR